ncbi:MAG: HD domain-containing protein [Bacteroidetes bacterium]|jgi:guanosine-3',5'-bis(diphosphate) 3'-pyrophosphohydrolase|nr:HD domain-containing protein [Bacteroidota bacterium]
MKKVIDAILFAAESHAGQFRKDGITPYINHPLEVMHLLIHTGEINDPEILIAAVLHDVVEDTNITIQEITDRFGEKVAKIVLELTDDKSLTKEERKMQQLISAIQLSESAKHIRISDKICNVYDILYAPPGDWGLERRKDYIVWANAVVGKIRGSNEKLEIRFDELIIEGNNF